MTLSPLFEPASLADLPDFKFGHAQDVQAGTGCTVFIAPEGACCGVDVSGGGPATRETDLLRSENMIESIHAVVLSGGSAFGLEASSGVMDALAKRSIGFQLGESCVPIVCGACLFDLSLGEPLHPDKEMGACAVESAFSQDVFSEGNAGAGTGASVGKLLGFESAMKSGFGFTVIKRGELVVGSFVAVNAVGNVMNPQGGWLAGCRNSQGTIVDPLEAISQIMSFEDMGEKDSTKDVHAPTNTTLSAIVTNAKLTKAQANKVSAMANDAYARAIKPVHTSQDGDAIFTLASGKVHAVPDLVGIMATEALESAIYRSIKNAQSAYGLPAAD